MYIYTYTHIYINHHQPHESTQNHHKVPRSRSAAQRFTDYHCLAEEAIANHRHNGTLLKRCPRGGPEAEQKHDPARACGNRKDVSKPTSSQPP